jgi:uncharacterized repeat protein (TIGR03803 family)
VRQFGRESGADGAGPVGGLVLGSDGNLYGMTQFGGSKNNGLVFRISPSGKLKQVFSFKGSNGSNPAAALIQGSDGKFYGTTEYGGAQGKGTVFKLDAGL